MLEQEVCVLFWFFFNRVCNEACLLTLYVILNSYAENDYTFYCRKTSFERFYSRLLNIMRKVLSAILISNFQVLKQTFLDIERNQIEHQESQWLVFSFFLDLNLKFRFIRIIYLQRQKMMPPTGVIDKATWLKISWSFDDVDELYNLIEEELNLKVGTESRYVAIGDEVADWQALLRYCGFFM